MSGLYLLNISILAVSTVSGTAVVTLTMVHIMDSEVAAA